jgi:hypothetical protein
VHTEHPRPGRYSFGAALELTDVQLETQIREITSFLGFLPIWHYGFHLIVMADKPPSLHTARR